MHAEVLQTFINECVNHTVMADMLEEGQVEECKEMIKLLKGKNAEADAHLIGVKAAVKRYTKDLGN